MTVSLNQRELHRLARVGAQARLQELERERALILRTFPGLKAGLAASIPAQRKGARRRRRMSAAQRKAVSLRMRKYWASRRKEKTGK